MIMPELESVEVVTGPHGEITVQIAHTSGLVFKNTFAPDAAKALRNHLQQERDEALGRWRDPEDPNMVVYPRDDVNTTVHDETTGAYLNWSREQAEDDEYSHGFGFATARAYFAAHPEPKPRPPFAAYVDKNGSAVWVTDENSNLRCLSDQNLDPEKYAPFTRLLPDE